MANLLNIKNVLKTLVYFSLGVISWAIVFLYITVTTPILAYRVFVTKLCATFSPDIRKPIYNAQHFATDYLPRYISSSYRSAVLCKLMFKGTISPTDFHETVERLLITRRNEHGEILIPEFQQYIHNFMGYMFWMQDRNFKLTNHVYLHDIGDKSTDKSSESFMCNLTEELLNKFFSLKKSPWEIHLVNNYMNSTISNEIMSVIIVRFHHAVADGVSMFNVLSDILYDKRIDDLKLVIPRSKPKSCFKFNCMLHVLPNILKTVYDSGYLVALWLQKYKTPWLVPSRIRANHQNFIATKIIPVDDIKRIKDKFGVNFTAVVLSCLSAAVSKNIKRGGMRLSSESDAMPILIPIPKWSNDKTLGVSSTAVLLDLPLTCSIDAVERLRKCQKSWQSAKQSILPFLVKQFCILVNSQPAIICRFLTRQLTYPIFLSNFPIPEDDAKWNGQNAMLGYDCSLGCQFGDAGVGIIIASYKGNARISITSEAAIMDKHDLNLFISAIEDELHQLDNWNLFFNS